MSIPTSSFGGPKAVNFLTDPNLDRESFLSSAFKHGSTDIGARSLADLITIGPASRLTNTLRGFGTTALPLGFSNLSEMLHRKGATDPGRLNQQLIGIERDTEAQAQGIESMLASRGLLGSGAGAALSSATAAGGADRMAQARAAEAALGEDRSRQDLQLLAQLLINPTIDLTAIASGQYAARQQADAAQSGAQMSALATLLSAFVK